MSIVQRRFKACRLNVSSFLGSSSLRAVLETGSCRGREREEKIASSSRGRPKTEHKNRIFIRIQDSGLVQTLVHVHRDAGRDMTQVYLSLF